MGNIVIPGVPASTLTPGIYINVELGRQPPSAAGVRRKVLLVGQNTLRGDPGALYGISALNGDGPNTAETLFGTSTADNLESRLYWMAKAAFKANPSVSLSAIKVDDSAGFGYDVVLDPAQSKAANQRFHYIVVDSADAAADGPLDWLKKYLDTLAEPLFGMRQQGIVAQGGEDYTPPGGVSDPHPEIRSPRIQYVLSPQIESGSTFEPDEHYSGFQLAASVAAMRSRHESLDPAVNLSLEKVVGVPQPLKEIKKATLNAFIGGGYSPLAPMEGSVVMLRSVTTAASSEHNDYPVLDTTKVTVTDFVADDIELKMVNRYKGFKLAPDTDIPPPSRTATPKGIKASLLEWLREHEKAGLITLVSDLAERVVVEIDPDVDGRVNFQIPEDVIEIFAVGAGNIIQIG